MIKNGRGLGSSINQRDIAARMAKAGQILNDSIEKKKVVKDARILERNRRTKNDITENSELVKQVMSPTDKV